MIHSLVIDILLLLCYRAFQIITSSFQTLPLSNHAIPTFLVFPQTYVFISFLSCDKSN
jgi:hypothetical protein